MLQMSTLLFGEPCRLSVKNLKFHTKLSWIEDKFVRINEKQANFRVQDTKSLIIQHPTVGSQRSNTPQVDW